MARKRKNIIDVISTRKFLVHAYGMKSREITDYEIEIFHEEFRGIFEWYHTSGTLLCRMQNRRKHSEKEIDYKHFQKHFEGEDVAITIQKFVYETIKKDSSLYWDKSERVNHKANLAALKNKIYEHRRESNTGNVRERDQEISIED